MGMGYCRFGCEEGTNTDYIIMMPDVGMTLKVCGLWEHYAREHNVYAPEQAREAIMSANIGKAKATKQVWRSAKPMPELSIFFVNKKGNSFDHKIGKEPDLEMIVKLSKLIDSVKSGKSPYQGGQMSYFSDDKPEKKYR